jgi:hypothetical protein
MMSGDLPAKIFLGEFGVEVKVQLNERGCMPVPDDLLELVGRDGLGTVVVVEHFKCRQIQRIRAAN